MQTKSPEDKIPLVDSAVNSDTAVHHASEKKRFMKAVTIGLLEVREGKVLELDDVLKKLGQY